MKDVEVCLVHKRSFPGDKWIASIYCVALAVNNNLGKEESRMTELIIFFGGLIAALYGSTAGGGGLVSFPLLLLVGFPTSVAIATNRFAAVILETVSALRFYREGELSAENLRLGLSLGIAAAVGAALGSYVVISLNDSLLNIIVGTTLFCVTAYLLLKKTKPESKSDRTDLTNKNLYFIHISATVLGIYGGILGAGMGTLMTAVLVGTGLRYVQSSAICRCAGVIWSGSASIVFAFSSKIDWYSAVILSLGFSLGAWIGAGIGARKGEGYVRLLLISVILASILKLMIDAL